MKMFTSEKLVINWVFYSFISSFVMEHENMFRPEPVMRRNQSIHLDSFIPCVDFWCCLRFFFSLKKLSHSEHLKSIFDPSAYNEDVHKWEGRDQLTFFTPLIGFITSVVMEHENMYRSEAEMRSKQLFGYCTPLKQKLNVAEHCVSARYTLAI